MNTSSVRARRITCALLAGSAYGALSVTQAHAQFVAPPAINLQDAHGVDLRRGTLGVSFEDISIGSGAFPQRLSLVRTYNSDSGLVGPFGVRSTHNFDLRAYRVTINGQVKVRIVRGSSTEEFTQTSPGVYSTTESAGATLSGTFSGTVETLTYALRDGSKITFSPTDSQNCNSTGQKCGRATSWDFPSGVAITFTYAPFLYSSGGINGTFTTVHALSAVSNNFGYRLNFMNQKHSRLALPITTSVSAVNTSEGGTALATVTYGYDATDTVLKTVTDPKGNATTLSYSGEQLAGIKPPGAPAPLKNIVYSNGKVSSVALVGSGTWEYSIGATQTTVTDPLSNVVTYFFGADGQPQWVKDGLNRQLSFTYDGNQRLKTAVYPEGNSVEVSYDVRGNITETRRKAKPGTGLADIVTSAVFSSGCSTLSSCNKPLSTTDARNNVTDYTYDTAHGGLTSITQPADANGVRPQRRFSYASVSGASLLAGSSACQTGTNCVGSAAEVKVSIGRDSQGDIISSSTGAGDGSLTATLAMTYDGAGNILTLDGPLPGAADTVRYRYDAARQLVGTTSPDPDGSGPLKHRSVRTTLRADGQSEKQEVGIVTDQSDGAWAGFQSLEATEIGFDANSRPVTSKLVAGGQAHALTQVSYDQLGRAECMAVRMNSGAFSSLPSSACNLGSEGNFGPDRITKTVYDAAGQVTEVRTALGTTEEAIEAATTFRPNGSIETLFDGENNRTTYEYDGHDRLLKTRFPNTTKGAGTSSTSDYEELGYDAAGNVLSRRNRAGEVASYTFDGLNRVTLKNLPGSEPDVSYVYDLLGRMISASQPGHVLGFSYDALGRQLTQTGPHGTVTSAFDLAGRRTRITHPDGFFADYEFLVTGETSHIRENGATNGVGVLATFSYNDLGRRISLVRGSGTSTSYTHDLVSRLTQLAIDLPGSSNDLQLVFSYNPANQIVDNTRSNDFYSWTQHGAGTTTTSANGLNQIANWHEAIAHDAKGNITSIGSATYSYSSENLLTSAPGYALTYDPLTRFYELIGTSGRRRVYDGDELIAEYHPSGSLARRFVHGPGVDEPLVWYGSGGTARRFLHADERGSIVSATDSTGAPVVTYRYDEYGGWGSGNTGTFFYTGQTGYTELGLYYHKSRWRNPKLDRFMQPDPIGYGDGLNMYAYVAADPINRADASGTQASCSGSNCDGDTIVVTGFRIPGSSGSGGAGEGGQPCGRPRAQGGFQRSGCTGAAESRARSARSRSRVPVPKKVKLDKSCAGVAALKDPNVQAATLDALSKSISGNPAGTAEHGFFGSENIFSDGFSTGSIFSSGHQSTIDGSLISRMHYGFLRSTVNGTYQPSVFVHTHPNNQPPSSITGDDRELAEDLGIPVAAVDKAGNVTCTRSPR